VKDELAIIVVRLSLVAGFLLAAFRLIGVVKISWLSIAVVALGPTMLSIIIITLYIVYRVKLKK
jgi:hypothetical protein